VCIAHHDELMQRRKEERERVVLETIRDGFEEELLPDEDAAQVMRLVQQEKKRRDVQKTKHQIVAIEPEITQEDKVKNRILAGLGKKKKFAKKEDKTTGVSLAAGPAAFLVSNMLKRGNIAIRPADEISYYCIISKPWLEAWKKFGLAGKFEDIEYPFPPPGPINNFELLVPGSSSDIKPQLVLDQDYCVVSPGVWDVLHDIYGGGPLLQREDVDVYSAHSGSSKVGIILC
jgi:hypothetical protein